ncbi:MAG TPA: TIGR00730 family Rossman fold protein [Alphaproteobacteria bacterium]|nr:TIGR00730 family Rossman fold protein [Alphaproteobacteria bacterium]
MAKVSSVCVFCGSSFGHDHRHRDDAVRLGQALAEHGLTLIYGGGGIGLMGALAQASLAAGGEVIGILPSFLARQEKGLKALTRLEIVDSMHVRKERMFALADAFLVLPGGLGTLDETFEVLTWKQLGLHQKPIVLVDLRGYWRPLRGLIAHLVEEGFAPARAEQFLRVVPSIEEALASLKKLARAESTPAADERL